jgi:hypothetical protein
MGEVDFDVLLLKTGKLGRDLELLFGFDNIRA